MGQFGVIGSGDGRLHSPTGVAVDAAGRVYVVDNLNNRIEVFDESGHYLTKWGLRGDGLGYLSQPTAVAVGCEGSVFVADTNNNRVERFDPASPAGVGCLPAGAWPPPLDVAPALRVSVPRRTGILARGGLALTVSCVRGCRILVTATLSPRSRRHPVALVAAARPLPAALTGHVRLRVGSAALRRLRRALGRHTQCSRSCISSPSAPPGDAPPSRGPTRSHADSAPGEPGPRAARPCDHGGARGRARWRAGDRGAEAR